MDRNGLRDVLAEAFRRLNKIAGLKIKFHYIADTLPAPGSRSNAPTSQSPSILAVALSQAVQNADLEHSLHALAFTCGPLHWCR